MPKKTETESEKSDQSHSILQNVRLLARVLRQYDLTEVEVTTDLAHIVLKRGNEVAVGQTLPMAVTASAAMVSQSNAAPEKSESDSSDNGSPGSLVVTTPFVGTFYRAVSPESPPFVQVAQTVHKGQTLCIVEAMKLMNEIEAECDAKILDILVNNGDPVEFGQPLFKLQPL